MKNILITGGTKGLGLATTKKLAEENYTIIATGRTLSCELEELMQSHGENVHFAKLDFLTDDLYDFAREITETYGPIFGLVNNAAIGLDGVLATMHESQIAELIEVNTKAPIVLTKYISRSMLVKGEGRIINVSSIIAETGFNGLSVYAASKAALIGFTKSLARELGKRNITVNAVAPGYMQTDMTSEIQEEKLHSIQRRSPMKKLATPEDVANGISFLLSPAANSITGITLTIDCGSTA